MSWKLSTDSWLN